MYDLPSNKLEKLYAEYASLMKAVAKKIFTDDGLAEDAVSDSIEKLIKNIDKVGGIRCNKTRSFIVTYEFIPIGPLWTIVEETDAHLRIISGRATMSGTVIGQPGTTSITANAVLERVNSDGTFSTISTFNNIRVTGRFWEWERTYHVARGHTYRLTITATVIRNGIIETVTVRHTARAD